MLIYLKISINNIYIKNYVSKHINMLNLFNY